MAKDVITRFKLETTDFDSKIKQAAKDLSDYSKTATQAKEGFNEFTKSNIDAAKALGTMTTSSTNAKDKVKELVASFNVAAKAYNSLTKEQQQADWAKALAGSLTQLQQRIKDTKAEMQSIQGELGGNKFMSSLSSAFSAFGPAALAASGVAAAVGGLKKVMGDVVSINMQFESSTAGLASIMGKTTDEISDLTAQAKQLGATTQYTAIQITELQTNLARLGFNQQEILNSTKAVQALATATGADLGEAANLAGAALRGFGLNATEMDRVASTLAVSTTKSALSFEKLATSVPIIAPVAKQLGFTIEDTVTLLGKLSDAGFDASTAATSTRNIFLNLANSGSKLSQALGRPVHSIEELGGALVELRQKGVDLAEMLELTDKRSVAAFATFVDNAHTLTAFRDSITGASDALDEMVTKRLDTLQGSVTIMKSAWEGLMLTFSESNGILKEVTDRLTDMLSAWTNWRNRRQGGDAAIMSFEEGLTDEKKRSADALVAGYRAGGTEDSEIKKKAEAEIEALNKERDAAKALYDQLEELQKSGARAQDIDYWNKQFRAAFPDYTAGKNGSAKGYLMRHIAGLNDQIAYQQYISSAVTPASQGVTSGSGQEGEGIADDKLTARLKAQYEAEEKAQIAALDRMAMQEEDYEAKVYEIRRVSMEKIAALYNEDTAEHARALARISQLEIEYQGKQMRFATRRDKGEDRTLASILGMPKKDTRVTEGNISALRQKLQKELSSATVGSEGYLIAADSLVDLNSFSNLLKAAVDSGLDLNSYQLQETLSKIRLGVDIPDEEWLELENKINEKRAQLSQESITLDVKTGGVKQVSEDVTKMQGEWVQAAQAVGQFASALQSVEDPTAKVAGIIAEAIASIAAGAGGAIAKKGTEGEPWSWVAFAITATATMVSTIAAIKNATKFEHGGMVEGNHFHGDNIVARLNSGEGVLTAKGVNNAATLEGIANSRASQPASTSFVTGEMIILGVNNYLARTGQGEIVTTQMLRRAGINL